MMGSIITKGLLASRWWLGKGEGYARGEWEKKGTSGRVVVIMSRELDWVGSKEAASP